MRNAPYTGSRSSALKKKDREATKRDQRRALRGLASRAGTYGRAGREDAFVAAMGHEAMNVYRECLAGRACLLPWGHEVPSWEYEDRKNRWREQSSLCGSVTTMKSCAFEHLRCEACKVELDLGLEAGLLEMTVLQFEEGPLTVVHWKGEAPGTYPAVDPSSEAR
jgi:hypothetical protein